MCRGPIKKPDRAFQKVIRKYCRDVRCLTDLVRCCILPDSIDKVKHVLEQILELSVNFGEKYKEDQYEETNLKIFKLCKIKDDFTREGLGYRYICLNLEVGWTIESESGDKLHFVTVKDFDKKHHVRTHVCEVQLLLRSTYDLKVDGCHDNFVKARNMLAQ